MGVVCPETGEATGEAGGLAGPEGRQTASRDAAKVPGSAPRQCNGGNDTSQNWKTFSLNFSCILELRKELRSASVFTPKTLAPPSLTLRTPICQWRKKARLLGVNWALPSVQLRGQHGFRRGHWGPDASLPAPRAAPESPRILALDRGLGARSGTTRKHSHFSIRRVKRARHLTMSFTDEVFQQLNFSNFTKVLQSKAASPRS
jgi:hypothetical protein